MSKKIIAWADKEREKLEGVGLSDDLVSIVEGVIKRTKRNERKKVYPDWKPMLTKDGGAWFGGKTHSVLAKYVDQEDAENFEDLDFLVVGYANNSTEEEDNE